MLSFEFSSVFDAPVETLFAFHERPDALELLVPPGPLAPKVLERTGGIQTGARVVLQLPMGIKWVALHTECVRNRLFVDRQQSGPFYFWEHHHIFESISDSQSKLTDSIRFSLPPRGLLDFAGGGIAKMQLRSMFQYRHSVTARECM